MPVAKSSSGDYKPIPAGVQHAVCYQVIDIGTQPSNGNLPPRRKVLIVWELPNEKAIFTDANGNGVKMPRSISKEYTLSTASKSNLRKDLEVWRGRPFTAEEIKAFDVGKLVGANCQIQVVHKPSAKDPIKIYSNVGAIMALAKGAPKLTADNPALVWDLPESGPITFPDGMPEWIQNKIKASEEWQERQSGHQAPAARPVASPSPADEDVPF